MLCLRHFDIHQGYKLLAAVEIAVLQITLRARSRDAEFERSRVVALEELHTVLGAVKKLRELSRRENSGAFDALIALVVGEHDVEGQNERPSVLAADQAG